MTNLHAVAERIGIRPAGELAYPLAFRDREEIVALDGDLRHYMLTGDRPMRIKAELGICDEYNRAAGPGCRVSTASTHREATPPTTAGWSAAR